MIRLTSPAGLALGLMLPALGVCAEFSAIDCPGADATQAVSLNNRGWVTGTCIYTNVSKSFIREPNGTVHVFTVSRAQTLAADINNSNVITGQYMTDRNSAHGFTYSAGVFTLFDYPGASYTVPLTINDSGTVTGLYEDASGFHAFVWDPGGAFTTFDPPSSTYTGPHSINSRGEIAGTFSHGLEPTKGFVRHANGNFSVFSVPGSFGTTAHQINYQGFVTGWWKPASNSYQAQGYTRDPVGNFTTFTSPDGQDGATYPMSINASGEVTGYGIQGSAPFGYFGFVQFGSATPVDFSEHNGVRYTESLRINDSGMVAGWYSDGTASHGFVGTAPPY